MGRPPAPRPQLRRDSLGSGGPAPVSVRHHFVVFFKCEVVIHDMRGASRRSRIPTTPCGIDARAAHGHLMSGPFPGRALAH